MAGEKGKRKRSSASAEEHRGGEVKGKPSAQKHRGGEPKIRKLAQEDMGKREGQLQAKGKMRRLEEEKAMEEILPRGEVVEAADDSAFEKTQEKIALFKAVVEHNCDHMVIPDYAAPLFPGGAAQVEELNAGVRTSVKEFKEHAAMRLKEFQAQGYLDYYPDPHREVPSFIFNDQGKADAQAI